MMSDPSLQEPPIDCAADSRWYRDAVIYQLHVKSFFDANDDGVGDFDGLIAKLDYIAELGVTAVWLLPFYPSPRRDDGYDIAEYVGVHPEYGTLEDAKRFIDAAHARGIRVITELVINHTSDQHPWFQAARNAPPGSPERDFYVWSDDDKKWPETRIIFLDTETSNWTWDPVAGAYYWHRFYSHQPDLNFDNPVVVGKVLEVMRYWLDAGVDGLRLDAIPYLVERDGTNNENLPETHEILRVIRRALDESHPDRMLLAEANQWPEDTLQYFGDGDECHMAFHFPLMPRMYMAIAQEDRFPITDIMRQTPPIPEGCQWAIFLRNHDELTLEMVTDKERDYLWATYAADRRARINLGIRRRLAPLLERDMARIRLMHSLLLTMPGTPVLYYGDEIGMGDNIHLGDRDGVRTPMQWSMDRNGGFSRADPAELTLPPIMDPLYGFQAVNVEAQARDPHSLLNWVKRLLAVRRRHCAFGRGTQRFLRPLNRKILAYLREFEGETILCVANMARTAQAVELDLSEFVGCTPLELSGGTPFPAIGQLTYMLTLPPYGFYAFELCAETNAPAWSTSTPGQDPERATLVLRRGVADVLDGEPRRTLEREVLPEYLPERRWFQAKDKRVQAAWLRAALELPGDEPMLLVEVEVEAGGETTLYALPLAIVWEDAPSGPFAPQVAMARVRRGRSIGELTDGLATPEFVAAVVRALASGLEAPLGDGRIVFATRSGFDLDPGMEVDWPSGEQSNTSVIVGQRAVLKLLRKLTIGEHPEAEMTRVLTERGFANTADLLGEVTAYGADGAPRTLMLVQRFVHNQGDGWDWTLAFLARALDDHAAQKGEPAQVLEAYDALAGPLGRRLAQMHAALAEPCEDPAFAPEAAGAAHASAWAERVRARLNDALAALAHHKADLDPEAAPTVRDLARRAEALRARIPALAAAAEGAPLIRIHGDLHLGQVLVTAGDVVLIDFEGEPSRPLSERRAKHSPLRDVAGVLRSFDYAAATALRRVAHDGDEAQDRAVALLDAFRARASEVFLAGYREGGGRIDSELLDLCLLEKAAYEVAYEAANRPDWLATPLSGLVALARRLLS
jgi:maltose alpha-D-glucosyltransferase/alpha-amylase